MSCHRDEDPFIEETKASSCLRPCAPIWHVVALALLFLCLPWTAAVAAPPRPIEVVTIDDAVNTNYATFQSHNQKVLSCPGGIFLAYNHSTNDANYTSQTWRLMRSTDGGSTFTTAYEATYSTHPPMIEADSTGNVYLAYGGRNGANGQFFRFDAAKNYTDPLIRVIPGASAEKYSMLLDEPRSRLFFATTNKNGIYTLGLDGQVQTSVTLLRDGSHAMLMYPHLSMPSRTSPSVVPELYYAWTTQKFGIYLYWDIHTMKSPDGGASWQTLAGSPLTLPVACDDSGPTDRITLDDEFEYHTWLSSFAWKGGKLHFCYEAQTKPAREHYVRYDAATGKRDLDIQPRFGGETISIFGLDGFFCSAGDRPSDDLFFVGQCGYKLGCLVSHDNGSTWHDFALSSQSFHALFSIGGCRKVVTIGGQRCIIGTFTDQYTTDNSGPIYNKVNFFKIVVGDLLRAQSPWPSY